MSNLATALFEHGRITTTEAKARRLRPVAEKLITFAKRGDLHARRQVLTVVTDKGVVHTLFAEIAPEYSERNGGYTRITKIGPRKGDNAALAVIELVPQETEARQRRRRARRSQAAAPATGRASQAEAEATSAADATADTEAERGDAGQPGDAEPEVAQDAEAGAESDDEGEGDQSDDDDKPEDAS